MRITTSKCNQGVAALLVSQSNFLTYARETFCRPGFQALSMPHGGELHRIRLHVYPIVADIFRYLSCGDMHDLS